MKLINLNNLQMKNKPYKLMDGILLIKEYVASVQQPEIYMYT